MEVVKSYEEFAFTLLYLTLSIGYIESIDAKIKSINCKCGVNKEISQLKGRIIGGEKVGKEKFPWQVAIFYKHKFQCGGSLINDRYILSAAHCFRMATYPANNIKVMSLNYMTFVFGAIELESFIKEHLGIIRKPNQTIIHGMYNPYTFSCDIALSKLNKPIEQFSYSISPICLPPLHQSYVKQSAFVTGWGATTESGGPVSHLLETEVIVLPNNECKSKLSISPFDPNVMLCAAKPGHDACQGDSGGPLVIKSTQKYYQIGIVSFGIGCGDYTKPGVFTEVSKFINWIVYHTRTDAHYCGV